MLTLAAALAVVLALVGSGTAAVLALDQRDQPGVAVAGVEAIEATFAPSPATTTSSPAPTDSLTEVEPDDADDLDDDEDDDSGEDEDRDDGPDDDELDLP
jgi:hypothetical protein